MFDERSPIMRRALLPYEDSMAGFAAELENRSAEFRTRLRALAEQEAERDRRLRAKLSTMDIEELLKPPVVRPDEEFLEFGAEEPEPVVPSRPVQRPRRPAPAVEEQDYSTQDWLDGGR